MEEMWFSSCKSDLYVWLQPALNANVVEHYQRVLLCTDTELAIAEEPGRFLPKELGKRLSLKEKSIGSLEKHLGSKLSQVTFENGVTF